MAGRRTSYNERKSSCPECGEPYVTYPPDGNHNRVTLDEKEANAHAGGTVIKIIHDCKSCKKPITLYWYRQKFAVSVG
jgi:uncharacterized protein with PIN domain